MITPRLDTPRALPFTAVITTAVLVAGLTGCAVQSPPIASVDAPQSVASQRAAQQALLNAAPATPSLKRKIALGRISNETSYGQSLLRDNSGDPLAENGNASAQNNIGYMFQRGEGVPTSPVEAVKWWGVAAENGLADAQNNLGTSYSSGFGVALNLREAVRWYRLAADQGHPMAQSNLGACYGAGRGVGQDWDASTYWYRLSAEQGDAFGLSNLGVAYANGRGVAQDFVQADKFYILAASAFRRNGDRIGLDRALRNRSMVERAMTQAQISEAVDLATKWSPRE